MQLLGVLSRTLTSIINTNPVPVELNRVILAAPGIRKRGTAPSIVERSFAFFFNDFPLRENLFHNIEDRTKGFLIPRSQ